MLGVFLWKLWYSSSSSLRLPAGVNWWQLCRLGCAGYQSRLFKLKPSAHRSIDPGKSACPPGSSTPMAPPAEFWGQHLSTGQVSLTMSYPGGAWTNAAIQSHWNRRGSLYMYIQWFTINVYTMVHYKCVLLCALYTSPIQSNETFWSENPVSFLDNLHN